MGSGTKTLSSNSTKKKHRGDSPSSSSSSFASSSSISDSVAHLSISHIFPKPQFLSSGIVVEVQTILDYFNPIEDSLEAITPFLSPNVVNSVVKDQRDIQLAFRFFVWAMKRKCFRSWASHNTMIDKLCEDKRFEIAWDLLEKLKVGSFPCARDTNRRCFTQNQQEERKVNSNMGSDSKTLSSDSKKEKHRGDSPSSSSSSFASSSSISDSVAHLSISHIFPKPRFLSFGIVVEVQTILDYFNPIEDSLEAITPFLSPNVVNSVVKGQRDIQLPFRFFVWAMKLKRFRSWASHNTMIDKLCEDKRFEIAWDLLEKLKVGSFPIVSHVFAVLISAYRKMGLVEKAVETFGKMKAFDCRLNTFTYNTILHILVGKDVLILALAVYNQMLKVDCRPNRATYGILINGLCKDGKPEDARQLFDEMEEFGLVRR